MIRLALGLLALASLPLAAQEPPIDFARALMECRPGAQWKCDETYESIIWLDHQQTKPTLAELQAAYLAVKAKDAKIAQAKAALEAGYTVQPEGFTLAMADSDRAQFTQLLTLIQEALSLGLITNDTPQTIADKAREKHTITTLRLRQILVGYGLHYKTIWDAATTP